MAERIANARMDQSAKRATVMTVPVQRRVNNHKPGAFASGDGCDCCEPLDPTLDPCCAREISDRRKHLEFLKKLRSRDPVQRAIEIRHNVVADLPPMPPSDPVGPPRFLDPLPKKEEQGEEEEEEEDWDDEDEIDEELMERLMSARVREIEEARLPGLRELSTEGALEALIQSTSTLVVLACDAENAAVGHIERFIATRMMLAHVCVRARGGALEHLASRARVPSDRLQGGALAVFQEGELLACNVGTAQFANEDTVAEDALATWLARARCPVPSTEENEETAAAVLAASYEEEETAGDDEVQTYYECGKPGCQRPFEHHHIGLGAAPKAWDVNSSK